MIPLYRNISRLVLGTNLLFMAAFTTPSQATTTTDLLQDIEERDYPLSLSGSYLAAVSAGRSRDMSAAALYFNKALENDPENVTLIERAFMLQLADGNIDKAVELSNNIIKLDRKNRFAHLALGVSYLKSKSYKSAIKQFVEINTGPLAKLTGTLLQAWTLAADSQVDEAITLVDSLEGPSWYESFQLYHTALIAELDGRIDQAKENFKAAYDRDHNVLRTTEAYARFLLRAGDVEEAAKIIKPLHQRFPQRPTIVELFDHLEAGTKPPATVKSAMEGGMEVLYGLGSAIGREGGEEISYVYLNLATFLAPENPLPRLILGDLLEDDKRFKKAIAHYESVPETSVHKSNAILRTAFAYNSMDNLEEARKILDDLLKKEPTNLFARASYGNILRSHELYEEARTVYSGAIALLKPKDERANWQLFYSRGITNERTKRWPEAEKDFRKALTLRPDEPQVLNYLGYSLIDQDLKYDEALDMIRRAVEQRPNDAYIVDSLGWAYYKLKRYDDAVSHLERAVELRPQDPVLNDHLGDAYWQVGRKLEATFQWSHARDLDPEPQNLEKIVRKLEEGLKPEKDG